MFNALLEDFEKSLGINRRGDDPGMKQALLFDEVVIQIEMAKDEEKFECVLANFEIICITTFGFLVDHFFSHPQFSISAGLSLMVCLMVTICYFTSCRYLSKMNAKLTCTANYLN
jgi:hypothetical protein